MRSTGEKMRERILDAIAELTAQNGRPPTNRELGQYLGGKSTGHIDYHLRILKDQGKINHEAKKSRGISLMHGGMERLPVPMSGKQVPVVGTIAAGRPIEAVLERDQYVTVPGVTEENLFALRVRGKSMIEDLIDDGDIVVCRRQQDASNGDTVVALIVSGPSESGEATLKRFYREEAQVRLEPRNPTMQPIYCQPDEVLIQGKVVTVIREM